ncbi:hypothetical protein JCGZ_23229 [Jatropha curcas]|uniref:Uncharacterized protein n=1 Tax=Jatropha curcas TaxID=180498 RepID=A0A067JHH4_JATCU|nr:hypothetical protein JCGZ_23229 [Jatropha curcas]
MKVITILLILGLALLLHLQVEARRLDLEQVKNERTDNQVQSNEPGAVNNAATAVDNDIKPNDEHGKSNTDRNPVTGSLPTVDPKTNNNDNSNTTSDDNEPNSNYGNYRNPSGSSIETHHVYSNDCNPKKVC